MVARIAGERRGGDAARGNAKIELLAGQLSSQPENFAPRPFPEMIFIFEGGPWRDESHNANARPKTALQIEGVGFGQERDLEFFGGGAQERRGDNQIAQSPEFHDEQFGFHAD